MKQKNTAKNNKTLKLIFVLLIMPLLLVGLFFVTKVTPAVVNGEVMPQSAADKTAYLFGDWRMLPAHVLPQDYNFNESQIIKVNRDFVPDDIPNYSLSANVRGFDPSRFSLCLYDVAFAERIYIDDTIVFSASDEALPYYNIVELEGLVEGNDFTITIMDDKRLRQAKVFQSPCPLARTIGCCLSSGIGACSAKISAGRHLFRILCFVRHNVCQKQIIYSVSSACFIGPYPPDGFGILYDTHTISGLACAFSVVVFAYIHGIGRTCLQH